METSRPTSGNIVNQTSAHHNQARTKRRLTRSSPLSETTLSIMPPVVRIDWLTQCHCGFLCPLSVNLRHLEVFASTISGQYLTNYNRSTCYFGLLILNVRFRTYLLDPRKQIPFLAEIGRCFASHGNLNFLLTVLVAYLSVDNSKSSTFFRSASLMFGCGVIGTPPVILSQLPLPPLRTFAISIFSAPALPLYFSATSFHGGPTSLVAIR